MLQTHGKHPVPSGIGKAATSAWLMQARSAFFGDRQALFEKISQPGLAVDLGTRARRSYTNCGRQKHGSPILELSFGISTNPAMALFEPRLCNP
jgi:hypothetical protein